ncbi:hypothetical protein [uncultured Tateyamaria sp.]|uniref:hypothetical protein n=1 Tax=uncultured Tateyamaria sp. TaxID=455651 RepID=UPI002617370D|nr:hypothetical protein [uncultured Tateyamaria sp.]
MTQQPLITALTALPAAPECGENLDLLFTLTNTTDALIDVTKVTFTLQVGMFPSDLATGFDGVELIAPTGWQLHQNGGTFTVTPSASNTGAVGAAGLEFQILNIMVNDAPGQTSVTMVAAHKPITHPNQPPDIAPCENTATLNKILPPLSLTDVYADPLPALYDGSTTIYWTGSSGAVIALDANGVTITHVKNDPSTPLPSAGSYALDEVTQPTIVTVTATASATAATAAELQKQITVPIAPPTATLTASVTPNANALPSATLNWTTTSANAATLTSTPPASTQTVSVGSSGMALPITGPTSFALTATNPVSATAATATQAVTPPSFTWVSAADGPVPLTEQVRLLETHAGLLLVTVGTDDVTTGSMWTSTDGLSWDQITTPPAFDYQLPVYTAVNAGTTYLSVAPKGSAPSMIYSSTDLQTWTALPQASFFAAFAPPAITFDDTGTAWAFAPFSEQMIWSSTDLMQTWTQVPQPNLPMGIGTCLIFTAGKLWSLGRITFGDPVLDLYSSTDGVTWDSHPPPTGVTGNASLHATVFNSEICFFVTQRHNPDPLPMAMWRIDASGTWTQDPAIPGQTMLDPTGYGLSLAQCNTALFTAGNGITAPKQGIWAKNA